MKTTTDNQIDPKPGQMIRLKEDCGCLPAGSKGIVLGYSERPNGVRVMNVWWVSGWVGYLTPYHVARLCEVVDE